MTPNDEFRERILATLEEAGEENIPTLMNTLAGSPDATWNVRVVQGILSDLLHDGLVTLAAQAAYGQRLTDLQLDAAKDEIVHIADWLHYDSARGYWLDGRITGRPYSDSYPNVRLTAAGRRESVRILSERGYEWWRSRS